MCKKTIVLFLGGFCLLTSGCNNEFDTISYADPVPIVYGILTPDEPVHNIRITRSFIGEKSFDEMVRNPDSLYFTDAKVFVELRSGDGFCHSRGEFLPIEYSPRTPGIFPESPNYLYQNSTLKIPSSFYENDILYLVFNMTIPSLNQSVFARTTVPYKPKVIEPNPNLPGTSMNLYGARPFYAQWWRDTLFYYEFIIEVNYTNFDSLDVPDPRVLSYRHPIGHFAQWQIDSIGPIHEFLLTKNLFFKIMKAKTDKDDVSYRKIGEINFILQNADKPMTDYLAALEFQSDYYTNVISNIVNGMGLFIAYNRIKFEGFSLDARSIDSLALSPETKSLKFVRW